MATQQTEEKLASGTLVAGKYLVEGPLGEGGFASVYAARHREIASLRFAIKVLHTEHTYDSRIRGRFRREAETVAALNSRNIVRVVDIGELADERPYIVMEFIDGRPLDALLQKCGRLYPADVARLSMDVLKALEVAHGQGVVHRDLKPANVFAVQEPDEPVSAKVLDFGIAKVVAEAGGATFAAGTHTVAGNVVCTPQYAAPELLAGKTSPLVDIYALGHMMAELLEGAAPYEHLLNPLLIAAEHLRPDPVPLGTHVQRSGMVEIIARACAKAEAERFQSAREMLEALRACQPNIPKSGPPLNLSKPYAVATLALGRGAHMQPDKTSTFTRSAGDSPQTPTWQSAMNAVPVAPPAETMFGDVPPRTRGLLPVVLGGVGLVTLAGLGLIYLLNQSSGTQPVPADAGATATVPTPEMATEPTPSASAPVNVDNAPVEAEVAPASALVAAELPAAVAPADGSAPTLNVVLADPANVVPQEAGEATEAGAEAGSTRPSDSEAAAEPRRPARRPTPRPAPVAEPEPTPAAEPASNSNPFGNIEIRR